MTPVTDSRTANGGLTASTPQGTRIATPLNSTTPSVDAPITSLALNPAGPSSAAPKMSYAGVAASAIEKATDFHLEFRLNDEVLPMDMTVYGACHQYESRRSTDGQPNPHAVWNGNYTITYRKIPGKRPVRGKRANFILPHLADISTETSKDSDSMETDLVAGLTPESPPSKILRLLRVLYRINAEGIEHLDSKMRIMTIPDAAFINNKLTAKLARQLEEIMILARFVRMLLPVCRN
jgi:E3 ubiquitin-protein ligase TRIP12